MFTSIPILFIQELNDENKIIVSRFLFFSSTNVKSIGYIYGLLEKLSTYDYMITVNNFNSIIIYHLAT